MRTVWLANEEPIDLAAISIMGVSVKTGSNPIGFFGTGLKFALATLLRTGHEVDLTLIRGEADTAFVQFKAVPVTIRGEEFQQVRMLFDGGETWQDLGFTTALGRNWEPWMAYRELRSNNMDEDGVVTDKYGDLAGRTWGTLFEVRGEAFAACHANAHTIFISTQPVYRHAEADIHKGPSQHVFYRGVRAADLQGSSLYRYNVKSQCTLTEDRTVKGEWEVMFHIARAILDCPDEDLLEEVLTAEKGSLEHSLDYAGNAGGYAPSKTFLKVVSQLRNSAHLNLSALKVWTQHARPDVLYTEARLDAYEESQVQEALRLVRRLLPDVRRSEFVFLDGMGEGIMGASRNGRSYISRRALEKGNRYLASTIYEELLHSREKLKDQTRDFQNFLFDKLFMTVERLEALSPSPPPPSPEEERWAAGFKDPDELMRQGLTVMTTEQFADKFNEKDDDDELPF